MNEKAFPQVGDVITSADFAFGYRNRPDDDFIKIDGESTSHIVTFNISEEERVALAATHGFIPPKTKDVELGAFDPSRGTAKFVVVEAGLEGGGPDSRDGYYPDGWHIKAQRLNPDGKFNPHGEIIHFYLSGSFANRLEPENVEVVTKMQRVFI